MGRRRGVTLLEVAVASSILGALLATVYLLLAATPEHCGDAMRADGLQSSARRCVDEIAGELRLADADTLAIGRHQGSDKVTFRLPSGEDAWGPFVEYRWEGAPGAPGRLVRDEAGKTRTLAADVAWGGLVLRRAALNIEVAVSMASKDGRGRPLAARVSTSATMRNRSGR